ncbi:hypothetical protein GCM10009715_43620 [Paeniglutamicibacter psychrophenolicus]|uniref:VIT1/CCC1 family predicted Fe2+/Mn2+ transporter n=1 Tax=Paeniglutamicibacter psychrophenolicus TaxID=257454 RepID=A0ABS4WE53_9MICC|nr:hypothetical protein [Paeniglutamicibacter psychrophenolicus]MBP2374418.1 VIT1/CCC1 family predicted Fe2+/Mn2+ transporter [Paeniglutamicibacter psychrophenolicus]
MAKHIATGTPTQVAHPVKTSLRTAVAYLVAAAIFLSAAIPLMQEHLGDYLPESWVVWLTGAAAFLVALATFITRLMALAQAQDFLANIGLGTGVENEPETIAGEFITDGPYEGFPVAGPHEPTRSPDRDWQ